MATTFARNANRKTSLTQFAGGGDRGRMVQLTTRNRDGKVAFVELSEDEARWVAKELKEWFQTPTNDVRDSEV